MAWPVFVAERTGPRSAALSDDGWRLLVEVESSRRRFASSARRSPLSRTDEQWHVAAFLEPRPSHAASNRRSSSSQKRKRRRDMGRLHPRHRRFGDFASSTSRRRSARVPVAVRGSRWTAPASSLHEGLDHAPGVTWRRWSACPNAEERDELVAAPSTSDRLGGAVRRP